LQRPRATPAVIFAELTGSKPPLGIESSPLDIEIIPAGRRFGRVYASAFPDPVGYGKTPSRFSDPRRRDTTPLADGREWVEAQRWRGGGREVATSWQLERVSGLPLVVRKMPISMILLARHASQPNSAKAAMSTRTALLLAGLLNELCIRFPS